MAHLDLTEDLDRRLRAARPLAARVDEHACDAELLARLRDLPIAARRTVPRAVAAPAALGVTLTAAAVVMLGGGPGDVGGPSSAAAITQALHWLDPPSGSILHVRSVERQAGQTTTRELWRSADDPSAEREAIQGAHAYETSGEALYDPQTNTIYDAPAKPPPPSAADHSADARKAARSKVAGTTPATSKKPGGEALPAGDPLVAKVRLLLEQGRMSVTGRETHDGVDAWAISLRADVGRPVWTLWVAAADGKPLELRDPGRDATEAPQVIRWPTYEVLPEGAPADANALLTLTGAHPSAHVVTDAAQTAAAAQRLMPPKP
jgi:hypothetical protein